MTDIKRFWQEATALVEDDTAAAVLVLAMVMQEKHMFDGSSAENFGHELAIALKNVLSEGGSLSVNAEVAVPLLDPLIIESRKPE